MRTNFIKEQNVLKSIMDTKHSGKTDPRRANMLSKARIQERKLKTLADTLSRIRIDYQKTYGDWY